MVCSLLVHHMFPSSNCHVHAPVDSSHGQVDALTTGSQGEGSRYSPLEWQVLVGFRRPAASKIAVFSMKASKAAPTMVYHIGRAPEHGAGQGIGYKLMARPLVPRCGTTHGHLDALAIVLLSRPCPTVHGILTYW